MVSESGWGSRLLMWLGEPAGVTFFGVVNEAGVFGWVALAGDRQGWWVVGDIADGVDDSSDEAVALLGHHDFLFRSQCWLVSDLRVEEEFVPGWELGSEVVEFALGDGVGEGR